MTTTDLRHHEARPARVDSAHRLCWRWKDSGVEGHGAWVHDLSIVEAWRDSLDRRHHDDMDNWVESVPLAELGSAPGLSLA